MVAVANEHCTSCAEDETPVVYFLRFEFAPEQIAAWRDGADGVLSVDHPVHSARQSLTLPARSARFAHFD